MTTAYCRHGLVEQKKFGMAQSANGLEICRGCRLPTAESLARVSPPGQAATTARIEDQPNPENFLAGDVVNGFRLGEDGKWRDYVATPSEKSLSALEASLLQLTAETRETNALLIWILVGVIILLVLTVIF